MAGCPNPAGYIRGNFVTDTGDYGTGAFTLPCGSWECPYCRTKKGQRVFARALQGALYADTQLHGFREKYLCKTFTLTFPGEPLRSRVSPEFAATMMRDAFNRLLKSMRMKYGKDFRYIRSTEKHESGMPHYHVLFVGKSIVPKSVLTDVVHWWRHNCGMGFVWVRHNENAKKAVWYVVKYLFKGPGRFGRLRCFSSSLRALAKFEGKTEWFNLVTFKGRGMGWLRGAVHKGLCWIGNGIVTVPEFVQPQSLRLVMTE